MNKEIPLLSEENLQFAQEVEDWQAAIRISAQPLLDTHIIQKEYVEKMIQNVLKLGDYIVIVPKVALAHARPNKDSKGNGISLLKLAKPVIFGEEKEVFLIICLATKDNDSHLKLLSNISALIDEEGKIEALLQLEDKKEFIRLANHYILEEEKENA
ncbi:PTS sugar transporter subunit IIA [Lactovum odontotermitis]